MKSPIKRTRFLIFLTRYLQVCLVGKDEKFGICINHSNISLNYFKKIPAGVRVTVRVVGQPLHVLKFDWLTLTCPRSATQGIRTREGE